MKILITNDDGIYAKGIYFLAKEIEKDHEVIVISPESQKSACSHSITIKETLFVKEVKLKGLKSKCYSLNGTPADCVKIGAEFIAKDFDMVLSGINIGSNLGGDVLYSGTVSAAIEGSMQKKPSIAFSLNSNDSESESFIYAAEYAREILNNSIKNKLKNDVVLNVNIPDIPKNEINGFKVCNLGNKIYEGCYKIVEDESGQKGYLNICYPRDDINENTDVYYINKGFITITPLHYDLTNFNIMKDIDNWF